MTFIKVTKQTLDRSIQLAYKLILKIQRPKRPFISKLKAWGIVDLFQPTVKLMLHIPPYLQSGFNLCRRVTQGIIHAHKEFSVKIVLKTNYNKD